MNVFEQDDLKKVKPGEQISEDNKNKDEKAKDKKKAWSKPTVTDKGKISVEDFMKLIKPKL